MRRGILLGVSYVYLKRNHFISFFLPIAKVFGTVVTVYKEWIGWLHDLLHFTLHILCNTKNGNKFNIQRFI